jgi:hypothetical protein
VSISSDGEGDPPVEAGHCLSFELEVEPELLDRVLPEAHRAEALEVGHALQVEDALDQLVGVAHLVHRLVAGVLGQAVVAPVGLHPGVPEVLVDRRELGGQQVVEQVDDLGGRMHLVVAPNGDDGPGGYWSRAELGGGLRGLGRRERRVDGEERADRGPAAAAARTGATAAGQLAHGAGAGLDLGPDRPVGHDLAVADDHLAVVRSCSGSETALRMGW